MPEWTCAQCESAAAADDRRLLESMGWRFDGDSVGADGNRGLCPICRKKEGLGEGREG